MMRRTVLRKWLTAVVAVGGIAVGRLLVEPQSV